MSWSYDPAESVDGECCQSDIARSAKLVENSTFLEMTGRQFRWAQKNHTHIHYCYGRLKGLNLQEANISRALVISIDP